MSIYVNNPNGFCKYLFILYVINALFVLSISLICCRNGSVCCGSPALLIHLPLQQLFSIFRFLFRLFSFSVSYPFYDRRRFLHLHISIPADSARLRATGSSCGDLCCFDCCNGGISHQIPPHSNPVGEFVLHGVRPVAGSADFQGDAANGVR